MFRTFTNGSPGTRLTNDNNDLFDLQSLDVDEFGIVQTFTVTASSGASHTVSGVGQIDFSVLAGDWTELSFVDFQYIGSSSTEMISLDNVQVTMSVPEPSSLTFLSLICGCAMVHSRRRRITKHR